MWSPILTTLLLLSVHHVEAQAINPDLVVWTTISQWQDLRICVQGALAGAGAVGFFFGNPSIQQVVGCTTNACLCRPDTLESAEQTLSSEASSSCSDVQDISTATSILLAYCSAKGYTSIIQPTILASSGACTAVPTPTATVTAYVTQYVTVSGASSKSSQLQMVKTGVAVLLVLLRHHSGIF